MTYKSIRDKDPWPHTCPEPRDLTREELLSILENYTSAYLTSWEHDFCESICERVKDGRWLTERQYEMLDKGLFKLLWDSDPALWEDDYEHV